MAELTDVELTLLKGEVETIRRSLVRLQNEVVRCKDCKHWASAEDYDCEIHSGAFGAEDYCSYGERKGGEDE